MKKYALLVAAASLFIFSSSASAASVVSFTASSPNSTNQAVTLTWRASAPTDAQIDVTCPSDSGGLGFYIKEGDSYPSCDKGGVASYTGQSSNALTIQPRGNTKTVSVDFVLTLLDNGVPGKTRKVTVTFAPTVTPNPTITSFVAAIANPLNQAISISWQTSAVAPEISLDVICTPGTISFYKKEGNSYLSCGEGRVAYYQNQSNNALTLLPSGNTSYLSVDFVLALRKNGVVIDSRKATVTIAPTVTPAPSIASLTATSPTVVNQTAVISWRSSSVPDHATLDVICPGNQEIKFYVPDTGGYPICKKGGIVYYSNRSSANTSVQVLDNTNALAVDFVLTLYKNNVAVDSRKVNVVYPPAEAKPFITSFTASVPDNVNGGVDLSWTTSVPTDAVIDFECPAGSIQFYAKEDNRTVGCEKGGLVSYSNQNWNAISIIPRGNTKTVSVDFVLRLTKNGAFTPGVNDSRKLTVNFLPQAPAVPVAPVIVVPPTNSKGAVEDIDTQAPVSSCLNLVNNLRYRSRDIYTNGEVSDLQDFLQSRRYLKSEPTGYFGLLTLQAVKDFQRDSSITPIAGFVGSVTRAKIKSLTCGQ
jgi:hypothetical protein